MSGTHIKRIYWFQNSFHLCARTNTFLNDTQLQIQTWTRWDVPWVTASGIGRIDSSKIFTQCRNTLHQSKCHCLAVTIIKAHAHTWKFWMRSPANARKTQEYIAKIEPRGPIGRDYTFGMVWEREHVTAGTVKVTWMCVRPEGFDLNTYCTVLHINFTNTPSQRPLRFGNHSGMLHSLHAY